MLKYEKSERTYSLQNLSAYILQTISFACRLTVCADAIAVCVCEEVSNVKRVKSACILQTLIFQQKDDLGFSAEKKLSLNKEEVEHYKKTLEKNKTRYQIIEEKESEDGSIVVRVRKQYNDKTDVSEYFE